MQSASCRKLLGRFRAPSIVFRQARRIHVLKPSRPSGPFNILFLGRDEFSVLVLNQLYESSDVWNKIVVATNQDEWIGRRRSQLSISPLKIRSQNLDLETHALPPKNAFREWKPPPPFIDPATSDENLLVTASFGRMLPDHLLHLFPITRRLNVHPSLIPLYRGPAPIQHAIADGRDETGVCILEMKEKKCGADGGEIWASKTMAIPPNSDFSRLRDALGIEGGKLLVSVLRDMINGTATAIPQDNSKASRAPFITQDTANIDFTNWDAAKVERMYRAIAHQKPIITFLPSAKSLQLYAPQVFSNISQENGLPKPLQALKNPGDATYDPFTNSLAIRCANNTYVLTPNVKQQDRKMLAAKEWWNGVRPEWINNGVLRLGGFFQRGDQTEKTAPKPWNHEAEITPNDS